MIVRITVEQKGERLFCNTVGTLAVRKLFAAVFVNKSKSCCRRSRLILVNMKPKTSPPTQKNTPQHAALHQLCWLYGPEPLVHCLATRRCSGAPPLGRSVARQSAAPFCKSALQAAPNLGVTKTLLAVGLIRGEWAMVLESIV